MNRYTSEYNSKKVTLEEALSVFKDGYTFGTSQNAIEPTGLFDNLHTLHGKVKDLTMLDGITLRDHPFMLDPKYKDLVEIESMFLMGPARKGLKMGTVTHVPGDLHLCCKRWLEAKGNHINIFWGMASPMDEHGYMCLSLCLIHEKELFDAADIVILEVNSNVPAVFGDTEIHIRDVDFIVETDTPLPELPKSSPTAEDRAMGGYIASLVNDGDTVQLGIGSVPDAVAAELMSKHDLGIHTELISNSVVDLAEAGVITGRKKTLHKGKMVTAFIMGDHRLYDFVDRNPAVMVMRGSYTNNPMVVAQNDNFVSINSALSVDLTGQVCSESVGPVQYSGTGGQVDTAVGAVHAKNGRNIIAVHSTAKGGTVSTITPFLAQGAVVTLPRTNLDCVVTEYGIAWMKGRSIRKRIDNLIAVAHPDFRGELRREAEKIWL